MSYQEYTLTMSHSVNHSVTHSVNHSVSLIILYLNRILGVHKDEIYNMRNHLRKSPRLRRKENIKNKNKINPE